jgi:hypothetical protein
MQRTLQVKRSSQCLKLAVSAEFFAAVNRQRFDFWPKRLEPIDNCITHQISSLVVHIGNHRLTTFAFHLPHYGLFVIGSNQCVTFAMLHLLAMLHLRWALAQPALIGICLRGPY